MRLKVKSALLIIALSLALFSTCKKNTVQNQQRNLYVWSHNDYEQKNPLETALNLGYQMIEADIHLIDGELYVVHDHPSNLNETPLLEDLYLIPIRNRVERNNGQVLPGKESFYLIIDVKTEAEPTHKVLLTKLEPFRELLFRKENGRWIDGPVRLLISGNRPSLSQDTSDQIVFLDGRLQNIGMGLSSELYPLISDNWTNYFSWDGIGNIPEEELHKLREYVKQVHAENKMIRFWATPDREEMWRTLINSGVDVINVDDLEGMKRFLEREAIDY